MKKIYLFSLALFFCVAAVSPAYVMNVFRMDGSTQSTKDIFIRDVRYPPTSQPRSAERLVEACYSEDASLLEFYFSSDIGAVTIYVLDGMQRCVGSYVCDTSIEPCAYLNVSLSGEDMYTIHVIGKMYEGLGSLSH